MVTNQSTMMPGSSGWGLNRSVPWPPVAGTFRRRQVRTIARAPLVQRIVDELLGRVGGGDVEQFHRLNRGRVFVVIGHNEQAGQLRRLPQELQAILEGSAR